MNLNFFSPQQLNGSFLFLKIALLIILFLYIIFALVILNQSINMKKVVKSSFGTVINIISALHIILAIALFMYTLLIL